MPRCKFDHVEESVRSSLTLSQLTTIQLLQHFTWIVVTRLFAQAGTAVPLLNLFCAVCVARARALWPSSNHTVVMPYCIWVVYDILHVARSVAGEDAEEAKFGKCSRSNPWSCTSAQFNTRLALPFSQHSVENSTNIVTLLPLLSTSVFRKHIYITRIGIAHCPPT